VESAIPSLPSSAGVQRWETFLAMKVLVSNSSARSTPEMGRKPAVMLL
jgi:hypothetical protein